MMCGLFCLLFYVWCDLHVTMLCALIWGELCCINCILCVLSYVLCFVVKLCDLCVVTVLYSVDLCVVHYMCYVVC